MSAINGPICSTDETFGDACNTSYNWYLSTKGDSIRVCEDRTPGSSSAQGYKGQICWDSNYIYVCVGTNSWKRAAISGLLW